MKISRHVVIPTALVLLAVATRYLYFHDSGTVNGMLIIFMQGAKWCIMHMHRYTFGLIVPAPKPLPYHACRHDLDRFAFLPFDALFLGSILLAASDRYRLELWHLWLRRKRPVRPAASPSLSSTQEV